MMWVLAIIIVVLIYNAERLPELMEKFKKEVPNMVEAGKKVSQELKQTAEKTIEEKKAAKKAAEKKDNKKAPQ